MRWNVEAGSAAAEYDAIRRDAMGWVREGGQLALEMFGRVSVSRKADHSFVTDADHAVQAHLLGSIGVSYAADAVISEETQANPARHPPVAASGRCWVVDPIDGTRSYMRCFPGFCVSVGLLDHGNPVVGVIYNPLTRQMYSASAGGGAWLDERRLFASDEPLSSETLIAIPSRSRGALPPVAHGWIDRFVIRNVGSTALHLAFLASGAIDAVLADECRLWDIAAGAVIVQESGARLVSLQGRPYFPMDLQAYSDEQTPFLAGGSPVLDDLISEYLSATGAK